MTKTLDLEEGIQEAVRLIGEVTEWPVLVAIFGFSNDGKSYLIDRLESHFLAKGLQVAGHEGTAGRSSFEGLGDAEKLRGTPYQDRCDLELYHCGYFTRSGEEDPNILAKEIANRGINLNIAIYNPLKAIVYKGETYIPREDLFDLIICNPNSKEKNYTYADFRRNLAKSRQKNHTKE